LLSGDSKSPTYFDRHIQALEQPSHQC